ncbi:MAG: TetR/AcrR family transcriptional regulator [Pseudomonadota bacterium]
MSTRARYHHGDLERALIDAVRAQLEEGLASKVSLAEAAKSVGVSTAAPYKHFRDKQDVLERIAGEGFSELGQLMSDAQKDGASAAEHIAASGKAYVRFALSNPGTFRLMFGSSPNVKDNADVTAQGHECFGVLITSVTRFLSERHSDRDPRTLSVMLWTFVHGLAALAMDKDYEAAGIDVDLDKMVDAVAESLLV